MPRPSHVYPRASAGALLLLVVGSCVGGRDGTGPEYAELDLTLQPTLVPSAADAGALPIHRIRTVVARQPDGAVLHEQRFDVSPTAASWNVEVRVPVERDATEVIVYLLLLHVGSDGAESVQFSGRTASLALSVGSRFEDVDADIVRGPLSNLSVTGVSIVSAPDTLYVGASADLSATVTMSTSTSAQLFWTSLDPTVLEVADSTATGVAVGSTRLVASAGAHADTASVVVIVPAVDSVRVSPDSADVQVGQTRAYTALLLDASGGTLAGRAVTWTTGNAQVATVSVTGVVSGTSPGTTTVRATSEGVFDEAVVRVTAAPTGGGANSWSKTSSGNWNDPANWSLGRVPAAGDTVVISQGGDYTVTLDANATVARLVLGGTTDVISLAVSGATLTIAGTVAGPELDILPLGGISMENGSLLADGIRNAGYLLSNGVAIVEADSVRSSGVWAAQTGVQVVAPTTGVWFEANGRLEIGQGSGLQLGPGSELLHAPDGSATIEGTGLLSLGEGSTMTLFQDLVIDGPSLLLQGSAVVPNGLEDLTIGPTSVLQLTSETGPAEVAVILDVQGALFVTGKDTRAAFLDIGSDASFYLSGSATDAVFSASAVQNAGNILISGLGMTLRALELTNQLGGTLTVGSGSAPFVLDGELTNGGTLLLASETLLRRTDTTGAHVSASHVNNGTIEIIDGGGLIVQLGGTAPSITNNGTISLEGSTAVLAVENLAAPGVGQIINAASGVLTGIGTVDVRTGIPGGVNNGTIAPGLFGPGGLTWMGSVPMGNTGTIAFELLGTTPVAEYDQLSLSADLIADGNLVVTAPGLTAAPGDRFAVLTFASRTGNFDTVTLPPLSGVALDTVWAEAGTQDTLYLVASAAAPAPVKTWINAAGGSWSTPSNWSDGTLPTSSDSVAIDLPGTYTVTLDVDATVRNLTVGAVSGTQTLAGTSRTLTIDGSSAVYANGQLILSSSTVAGSGALRNSGSISLTNGVISAPLTNSGGQIGMTGSPSFTGVFRNLSGSTLTLGALTGHTTLTVQNGFTNDGTIALTNTGAAYDATLAVTNGTLVNGGTLAVFPGSGGARTLAAELDNQGTLTLDHPLTIDRTDAAHVNNSSISIPTDDLTIVQSAGGSFTNNGTISVGPGRTVTVSGGTLDLDQGAMSGAAATLSVGAGATLEFTTGTVTIPMTIEASVTIPSDVTVPAGQILTLLDNTVIDEPIDNSGTIIVAQDVVFNGALTMATVGSVLRVGGLAGHTVLTVANGFTNLGTIELTSFGAAYNSTLDITTGSLLNQGSITPLTGSGGARTLDASLDNQGLIPMSYSMTVTGALNQLSSPGNITLSVSGTTLTVGGLMTVSTGTFTTANPGTSIVTLGGCLNSGGQISGWTCTP